MGKPSNRELAGRFGVSRSMASRIRNGQRLPGVRTLGRIQRELDIPWEELVCAHEEGPEEFGKLIRDRTEPEELAA